MNPAPELERLTKLRAEGSLTEEEFTRAKAHLLSAQLSSGIPMTGIRRQSARKWCGLPLWAIAVGPDSERGERRGHARAVFAFGDIATGWVALGGLARGFFAFGGLAVGVVSFGGGAVGLLVAFGGLAIGSFAVGGLALGLVAVGGCACGYYACGGAALGVHTISALHQDPEAVNFFKQHFPSLTRFLKL